MEVPLIISFVLIAAAAVIYMRLRREIHLLKMELTEAKQRYIFSEQHDTLTGFYKHSVFLKKMQELLDSGRELGVGCVIVFELESMKFIDGRYRHRYADEYVTQFSDILKSQFHADCMFSRHSGGMFYGFIYGYQTVDELRQKLESMFSKFKMIIIKVAEEGESLPMKVSAGLSWYPADSADLFELINYADFAFILKHKNPTGQFAEFSRERYNKDGYLLSSMEPFLQFIENRFVKYAFQAIVEVSTAKIYGYELLMRPLKPELRGPLDVLNLARIHSKLHVIENITWFEGMRAFIEQVERGMIPCNSKIFINSIGGVVLSSDELDKFYEKYNAYVNNLVIEVTENEQDDGECIKIKRETADRWKAMIAIDDYGSGYNGESSLLCLHPNIVKVDISIIQGVDHDSDRLQLLKNIVDYAKQRNIRIIAEGVSTCEELKTVIMCGVDYVQGFYLSEPLFMPEDISMDLKHEICQYKCG